MLISHRSLLPSMKNSRYFVTSHQQNKTRNSRVLVLTRFRTGSFSHCLHHRCVCMDVCWWTTIPGERPPLFAPLKYNNAKKTDTANAWNWTFLRAESNGIATVWFKGGVIVEMFDRSRTSLCVLIECDEVSSTSLFI